MDRLRFWGIILFIILGISTTAFGGYVGVRTYEMDNFEGTTILIGQVIDTEGEPLEDVLVRSCEITDETDADGRFRLRGVDQGLVDVEFYRKDYVKLVVSWLAYPMYEIGYGDLGDSPNNMSNGYDIEMKKEVSGNTLGQPYENGTLELVIEVDDIKPEELDSVYTISNGTKEKRSIDLRNDTNIVTIETNGTFEIEVEGGGKLFGFYPVGNTIDITAAIVEVLDSEIDMEWEPAPVVIDLKIYPESDLHGTKFEMIGPFKRIVWQDEYDLQKDEVVLDLIIKPGVYSLHVHGEEVRDVIMNDIVFTNDSQSSFDLELKKADTEKDLDGRSIKANYPISVIYILLAFGMFVGAYLLRRHGSWTTIIILAFISFLSRGLIQLAFVNVNLLFSVPLVIIILYMRRQEKKAENRS